MIFLLLPMKQRIMYFDHVQEVVRRWGHRDFGENGLKLAFQSRFSVLIDNTANG